MARIRTIKPEFFTHEDLYNAEKETGYPLRIAFSGIWTICDREGRFKWKPNTIKLSVLPFDELDFSRVLDALASRGFIEQYESVTGEMYGFVPSFLEHQVINNRETPSLIPSPFDACCTRDPRGLSMHMGKGKEGKGKEEEGKECGENGNASKKRQKISFDLTTSQFTGYESKMEVWSKAYPAIDLNIELNKAAAWLVANPKNMKSNYERFLTNWFSRAQDKAPAAGGGSSINGKPWYITASGIEAKAKELNIDIAGRLVAEYRTEVYKAAGITPEMVRKATADYAS